MKIYIYFGLIVATTIACVFFLQTFKWLRVENIFCIILFKTPAPVFQLHLPLVLQGTDSYSHDIKFFKFINTVSFT